MHCASRKHRRSYRDAPSTSRRPVSCDAHRAITRVLSALTLTIALHERQSVCAWRNRNCMKRRARPRRARHFGTGGSMMITRRRFLSSAALASAGSAIHPAFAAGAKKRKLKVGHTGITWRNDQVADAIAGIASLGFYGFETFGDNLIKWEDQGGMAPLLQKHNLPLISGYCTINLTEPAQRDTELAKADKYCDVIKKNGGRIYVVGPNSVRRNTYDFAGSKANIITTLNELAKRVEGHGLTPVLHQHTGTCIESRDETYAILEGADTKHLKF